VKLQWLLAKGPKTLAAKCGNESPANHEQLMEEVCEREKLLAGFQASEVNKGSPGIDGMTVR